MLINLWCKICLIWDAFDDFIMVRLGYEFLENSQESLGSVVSRGYNTIMGDVILV